jgi:DoxX-like family
VVKEFHEYHLPDSIRTLVGAAKISLATLLIAGIWYPRLVLVPALLMSFLMVCAQVAHRRAHHPWQKYVPSLILLALSLFVGGVYGRVLHA